MKDFEDNFASLEDVLRDLHIESEGQNPSNSQNIDDLPIMVCSKIKQFSSF